MLEARFSKNCKRPHGYILTNNGQKIKAFIFDSCDRKYIVAKSNNKLFKVGEITMTNDILTQKVGKYNQVGIAKIYGIDCTYIVLENEKEIVII